MSEKYIAILDSGIGGLSVMKELVKLMPNENYIFLGDRCNLPYGNKSKRQLLDITVNNVNKLMRYKLKAIVLGCNTLSVTVRKEISSIFNCAVFGVYPPVEKCLCGGKKTILLCTRRTAETYKKYANLDICIQENLAYEIEKNKFSLEKVPLDLSVLNKRRYDSVILGCTHYFFVKNLIFNHKKPPEIFRGETYTAKRVFNCLKKSKKLKNISKNQLIFFNDKNDEYQKFWSVINSSFEINN